VTRRDIPNLITAFRFLLVPPVVFLLLSSRFGEALVIFAIAGFSDALDGFLAKHYGWASRLGAALDPLADKLLLVSAFIALGWLELIPVWLVVIVILRDIVHGQQAEHSGTDSFCPAGDLDAGRAGCARFLG